MTLIDKLQPFLTDMDNCLENGQYNAALFIALALPDICSSTDMAHFGYKVGDRYKKWIDEYFIKQNGYDGKIAMIPTDVYLLRCAYMHSGLDKLKRKAAAKVIAKFSFVASPSTTIFMHRNLIEKNGVTTMQLDISAYCNEIKYSVALFVRDYNDDETVNNASINILHVQNVDQDFII